jgi:hypothetical protein
MLGWLLATRLLLLFSYGTRVVLAELDRGMKKLRPLDASNADGYLALDPTVNDCSEEGGERGGEASDSERGDRSSIPVVSLLLKIPLPLRLLRVRFSPSSDRSH